LTLSRLTKVRMSILEFEASNGNVPYRSSKKAVSGKDACW